MDRRQTQYESKEKGIRVTTRQCISRGTRKNNRKVIRDERMKLFDMVLYGVMFGMAMILLDYYVVPGGLY